jgi:methyl-accepting chemotaxis protein
MKINLNSISTRIGAAILGVFLLATLALAVLQQYLYTRNFETVLGDLSQSISNVKLDDALDLLQEIKFATESSLQRGEFESFMNFAKQQSKLKEIQEFSFISRDAKVEHSSDAQKVGTTLDPEIWKKIQDSKELITIDNQNAILFYYPLRVDDDMRRLDPKKKVGEIFGALHLKFSKDKINKMLAKADSDRQAQSRRAYVFLAVSTAIASLIVIAVAWYISHKITKPIINGLAFAQNLASGDLTQSLDIQGKDEVGQLAKALNHMTESLRKMFGGIHNSATALAGSSTQLKSTSDQMAKGAKDTTDQSSVVAAAAEHLASNMRNMASATEQMSANVKMVASAAEEMTSSISEIAKNAEQASTVAGNAASMAQSSNLVIGELGSAADEIGKVIQVIQDIAEQTNLLALNATIEAARAGDAGKGFSVVATEVKELAKQTAEATENIRSRIEGIQTSTGQAIKSIGQISDIIQQVNDISKTIASAVEEQSATTKEIAMNIAQTSHAAETVSASVEQSASASKEITQSIAGVDHAARQTAQGALQTQTAGVELSKLADELQRYVGQFQV